MLFDVRTYTCRPGSIRKHMELYREKGWDAQRRHLGEPLFYGTGGVGRSEPVRPHLGVRERGRPREEAGRHVGGPGLAGVHRGERGGRLARQAGEQADGERAVVRVERQAEVGSTSRRARRCRRGRRSCALVQPSCWRASAADRLAAAIDAVVRQDFAGRVLPFDSAAESARIDIPGQGLCGPSPEAGVRSPWRGGACTRR